MGHYQLYGNVSSCVVEGGERDPFDLSLTHTVLFAQGFKDGVS